MVSNEKYIKLLKSMISCISNGDYSSAKELSNLELEKMIGADISLKKDVKKVKRFTGLSKNKNMPLEKWESKDLIKLIDIYSKYISKKIETTIDLEELKEETISIYEFIEKF